MQKSEATAGEINLREGPPTNGGISNYAVGRYLAFASELELPP